MHSLFQLADLYQQQLDAVRQLPANIAACIVVDLVAHPELGTPCWLWTGRFNRNGYGRCCIGGKEPVAHRAVYELLKGPIPEKHILDHKCKIRNCVNFAHMEPVTHRVNTLRGYAVLYEPLLKVPSDAVWQTEVSSAGTDLRRLEIAGGPDDQRQQPGYGNQVSVGWQIPEVGVVCCVEAPASGGGSSSHGRVRRTIGQELIEVGGIIAAALVGIYFLSRMS